MTHKQRILGIKTSFFFPAQYNTPAYNVFTTIFLTFVFHENYPTVNYFSFSLTLPV